ALLDASDPLDVARRRVAISGLGGLLSFLEGGERTSTRGSTEPFVDEIVTILQLCQTVDDEGAVLREVCKRARRHLHAAAVAVILAQATRVEPFVSDGPRIDSEIATRAVDAGISIPPHRIGERLEAAAAVHYAGNVAGAVCVRWTPGAADDVSRAPG